MQWQSEYDKHVAERAAMGVVPAPINATQCADLVKLLENPPKGEEDFLLNLLTQRVPPGVDDAAYVKASFLTAIVKGISPARAARSHLAPPRPLPPPSSCLLPTFIHKSSGWWEGEGEVEHAHLARAPSHRDLRHALLPALPP